MFCKIIQFMFSFLSFAYKFSLINFWLFEVCNYFSFKAVTILTSLTNVVYCFKGSCDKTQL